MIALVEVRKIFRKTHLRMEQSNRFSRITTSLIPLSSQESLTGFVGTSLNFTIDGDLKDCLNSNRKAFGVSLMISHTTGQWLIESEYGWGGVDFGIDPAYSMEHKYQASTDLISDLSIAAENLCTSALIFLDRNPHN